MCESDVFKSQYVDQILASRDSIFNEMCKASDVEDFTDLRAVKLNKRTVSKDKLCEWLESLCCILDSYCAPVLASASELPDSINKLKDEKISDQKTIIELQRKLIDKKDDELGTVKSVVKSQMESYSSVLKSTCSKALAPTKMKAAMKRVADDEDRSRNLIIYGLKEDDNEILVDKVCGVLEHLNEKPRIVSCCRIGKDTSDRVSVKPVKITLSGSDSVRQILIKTKLLKEVEGCKSIYICPDRSIEHRLAYKKLIEELKLKRTNEANKVHVIKNNKIVSFEKDE